VGTPVRVHVGASRDNPLEAYTFGGEHMKPSSKRGASSQKCERANKKTKMGMGKASDEVVEVVDKVKAPSIPENGGGANNKKKKTDEGEVVEVVDKVKAPSIPENGGEANNKKKKTDEGEVVEVVDKVKAPSNPENGGGANKKKKTEMKKSSGDREESDKGKKGEEARNMDKDIRRMDHNLLSLTVLRLVENGQS
jgi:hypothetical protein